MVVEIWTDGRKPYPKMNNRAVRAGLEHDPNFMHPNVGCEVELYNLMKDCWKQDADARPSFARILQRLEDMRGQLRQDENPAHSAPAAGSSAGTPPTDENDGYERPVVRSTGAAAAAAPTIATTVFGVYGPSIITAAAKPKKSKRKTAPRLVTNAAAATVISPIYDFSGTVALLDSQV